MALDKYKPMNYYSVEMPLPSFLQAENLDAVELDQGVYLYQKKWLITRGWLKLNIAKINKTFTFALWVKFDYKYIYEFQMIGKQSQHEAPGFLVSNVPFYNEGKDCEVKIIFNPLEPSFREPDIYISPAANEIFEDQRRGLLFDKYVRWMELLQSGDTDKIIRIDAT